MELSSADRPPLQSDTNTEAPEYSVRRGLDINDNAVTNPASSKIGPTVPITTVGLSGSSAREDNPSIFGAPPGVIVARHALSNQTSACDNVNRGAIQVTDQYPRRELAAQYARGHLAQTQPSSSVVRPVDYVSGSGERGYPSDAMITKQISRDQYPMRIDYPVHVPPGYPPERPPVIANNLSTPKMKAPDFSKFSPTATATAPGPSSAAVTSRIASYSPHPYAKEFLVDQDNFNAIRKRFNYIDDLQLKPQTESLPVAQQPPSNSWSGYQSLDQPARSRPEYKDLPYDPVARQRPQLVNGGGQGRPPNDNRIPVSMYSSHPSLRAGDTRMPPTHYGLPGHSARSNQRPSVTTGQELRHTPSGQQIELRHDRVLGNDRDQHFLPGASSQRIDAGAHGRQMYTAAPLPPTSTFMPHNIQNFHPREVPSAPPRSLADYTGRHSYYLPANQAPASTVRLPLSNLPKFHLEHTSSVSTLNQRSSPVEQQNRPAVLQSSCQRREATPLDLSVRTVKTIADSTGGGYDSQAPRLIQGRSTSALKVNYVPNFSQRPLQPAASSGEVQRPSISTAPGYVGPSQEVNSAEFPQWSQAPYGFPSSRQSAIHPQVPQERIEVPATGLRYERPLSSLDDRLRPYDSQTRPIVLVERKRHSQEMIPMTEHSSMPKAMKLNGTSHIAGSGVHYPSMGGARIDHPQRDYGISPILPDQFPKREVLTTAGWAAHQHHSQREPDMEHLRRLQQQRPPVAVQSHAGIRPQGHASLYLDPHSQAAEISVPRPVTTSHYMPGYQLPPVASPALAARDSPTGPWPVKSEYLATTLPPKASGGATPNVLSKLKSSLVEKQNQKQMLQKQIEAAAESADNNSMARFRTKGELKGFTAQSAAAGVINATVLISPSSEKNVLAETLTKEQICSFDLTVFGSACNDFVNQLQTGKKKTVKRPKKDTEKAPAGHEDKQPPDSSSDEDQPLVLIRQRSLEKAKQAPIVDPSPVRPTSSAPLNSTKRKRLQHEKRHAAKFVNASSSEDESEVKKPRKPLRRKRVKAAPSPVVAKPVVQSSVSSSSDPEESRKGKDKDEGGRQPKTTAAVPSRGKQRRQLPPEKLMTRSRKKQDLADQEANSLILRNDKKVNKAQQKNGRLRVADKKTLKCGNSESSENEQKRSSSGARKGKQTSPVTKEASKNVAVSGLTKCEVVIYPLKKAGGRKGKDLVSKQESDFLDESHKEDKQDDYQMYEFKRSLKVPESLIHLEAEKWHRVSSSLPDLEPHSHSSGEEELFPSRYSSNFHRSSTTLGSIIDLVHRRVIRSSKRLPKAKDPSAPLAQTPTPKPQLKAKDLLIPTPVLVRTTRKSRANAKVEEQVEEIVTKNIFQGRAKKSRTRKEYNVDKNNEIIREIFGCEDRPASAPPGGSPGGSTFSLLDARMAQYETFVINQLNCDRSIEQLCLTGPNEMSSIRLAMSIDEFIKDNVVIFQRPIVQDEDPDHGGVVMRAVGRRGYTRRRVQGKRPLPGHARAQLVFHKDRKEQDIAKEIKGWVLNKGVGESLLHKATRMNLLDVVAFCLARMGLHPDQKDNAGYTPLHEACSRGHLDIARLLLQHGANPSESSPSGIRPLHDAVESGHLEIVRLLLAYGADPNLATYAGQTPMDLAEDDVDMELFLLGHQADLSWEGHKRQPWRFTGAWQGKSLSESGYDTLAGAPDESAEKRSATVVVAPAEELVRVVPSTRKSTALNQTVKKLSEELNGIAEADVCIVSESPKKESPEPTQAPTDDAETFEFEECESVLPPVYLLRDEGADKWCLLTDLQNLLKFKTKETLLKQICPPDGKKEDLVREFKMEEFLQKATCLQLLCSGEKLNIRASKVSLIKYTETVRSLLGVETIVMRL